MMTPVQRADCYNCAFPDRPPLSTFKPAGYRGTQWVCGTWAIGACYKNPNPLYGAYPHGYLERVHSMFPDTCSILHVFSGGLTKDAAEMAAAKGEAMAHELPLEVTGPFDIELVDLHGPEQGRHPTWQGDLHAMPAEWNGRFDLVLADPPYSAADAEKYGTPMVNRGQVLRTLRRVTKKGGNLVWLDVVWPMHRKEDWHTWAQIGLVRSTNHRVRLVSMFEAV